MEAKDVLKELRQRHNMTQDQLSEKLAVTRQAVSRWENGESVPNPETLKQLSALFDTSINHLLGDPRKLICQCCGMPLDSDEVISRDLDGSFNEDYCKWCYTEAWYISSVPISIAYAVLFPHSHGVFVTVTTMRHITGSNNQVTKSST